MFTTGGIGTSLELYTDVTKVKEKDFRATFEIKGKALYPKMDVASFHDARDPHGIKAG